MARQTRQQRQARRLKDGGAAETVAPSAPERAPEAADKGAPPRPPRPPRDRDHERHVPGEGGKNFVQESIAELKKVEWPGQAQVIQGTIVVLIACIIVGVYLYAADAAFKNLVNEIFLR